MNTKPISEADFVQTLDFVALDLETTGLDPKKNEIIEIAAIRYVQGKKTDVFQSFVSPKGSIPKFIYHLTHIDPQMLQKAPRLEDVLPQVIQFIGDSVIVGQNVSFDIGFLDAALQREGRPVITNDRWDTMELSRIYLPFINDHSLGTICRYFDIDLVNAHRADADAEATAELMIKLAEYIVKHFAMMINARILDLSHQAQNQDSSGHFLRKVLEWQRRNLGMKKVSLPPNKRVNVVEHKFVDDKILSMDEIFGEQGVLHKRFENFEYRSGQRDMGKSVEDAFAQAKHLAVEAGTGVGKSFAYLVPAMQHSLRHKDTVVVSTNTKNLQEQLFFQDIPRLKELLPISFKAVLVKGRENYLCIRRWNDLLMEQTRGLSSWDAQGLSYLFIWKELSHSGDVSENSSFDRKRFGSLWRRINSDRFSCMGRRCPHFNECYVMQLRKHVETASLVVANHSLLLADLQNENTTLGEYTHLVVDEAHNLPSAAQSLLGFEFSYLENVSAFNQLAGSGKKRGGLIQQTFTYLDKSALDNAPKEQATSMLTKLTEDVERLRKVNTELFTSAQKLANQPDTFGKLRIKSVEGFASLYEQVDEMVDAWKDLMKDMQALINIYSTFKPQLIRAVEETLDNLQSAWQRFGEMETKLLRIQNPDLESFALWLESDYRPDRNIPATSFCYAPVVVDKNLYDLLYDRLSSIVFTSATLALRGSFKYFHNQSGLHLIEPDRLTCTIVDSPFDYDKQSKLVIGSFLPEPKDKFFFNQALGCIRQILHSTDVGTMMLFTSYNDLNNVYDQIGDELYQRGRPFFAQGKIGSRSSILEEFKNHNNAVLLGTSSFWEGVDVRGESLALLVLFRLPFLVPNDPIVEAYIDKLEREGKDSFMHYMLPNALLKLRQGFGRLIRSKSDRGAVLIMDSRVSTKKYGSFFKEVLPTRSLEMKSEHELINVISQFFNAP
ncbi:MAG: DEAD/DEAH box helicase family protein [Candidatus Cloacimonetes bacterium]|nr:DEAD/DEAH box helicase family protein [Candidatus Cloacimonadota bacterium]